MNTQTAKKASEMTTLDLDTILNATTFADLFPSGTRKELRGLLKSTHPDLHPTEPEKAQKAFVHVNVIWKLKDKPSTKVHAGSSPSSTQTTTPAEDTIHTKKNTFSDVKLIRSNGGVKTYSAVTESGQQRTLNISTHPRVGEKLQAGIRTLKTIKTEIPEQFTEFFPDTVDAFQINQKAGKLFGVAQTITPAFYTLREVMEDYPEGIPGEDVAWMFRRMLVSIGNTHDAGYAHGGIDADAFLIEPETHKLILTNWQYVTELGSEVSMVTQDTEPWFSENKKTTLLTVNGKTVQPSQTKTATQQKELQMLGFLADKLLEKKAPALLRRFLTAVVKFPAESAAETLGDFDFILKQVYGARTFHKFQMKR